MAKSSAVVIYSGGMDSFTLLNKVLADGWHDSVAALSVNYGQRHVKELEYAKTFTAERGIRHVVVDLQGLSSVLSASALTDPATAVPEGHYSHESMKLTVVPNRNMVLLSIAAGYAISLGADTVYYGAHAGDHAIYPDCRGEFVDAMNGVLAVANYKPITIRAPFLDLSKGEIAVIGKKLGLDYGKSWTCYNGKVLACGKCGACVERLEAMAFAGLVDPVVYV